MENADPIVPWTASMVTGGAFDGGAFDHGRDIIVGLRRKDIKHLTK